MLEQMGPFLELLVKVVVNVFIAWGCAEGVGVLAGWKEGSSFFRRKGLISLGVSIVLSVVAVAAGWLPHGTSDDMMLNVAMVGTYTAAIALGAFVGNSFYNTILRKLGWKQ